MTTTRGTQASTPTVGEVWISNSTGNYYRVDAIDGNKVSVTRLGYAVGQQDYIAPQKDNSHVWDVCAFGSKDFRRLARKAARFEAFLAENAVNACPKTGGEHDYDEQTGSCYCGDVWSEGKETASQV